MKSSLRRVLPADHELVRRALVDFRLEENGESWVVRLKGEGRFPSSVFPEFPEAKQVLLELIPAANWQRPSLVRRWGLALRLPYLLFSLLPMLLVACRQYAETGQIPILVTSLLFLSVTLVHLSCNLWGDYEDHLRGIDAPEHSGGSGVVRRLWIPAVHLRRAAMALMAGGLAFGLGLLAAMPIAVVGDELVWFGLLGAIGAASYSGWPFHYKYIGLGEPIVFFLSGPIVTAGASLIYFDDHLRFFALASLPLAFLAVLRLHGGNMQRIPFDTIAGVFTIARRLGFAWSKGALGFLFFAPFLALGGLWAAGLLPRASLLCLLTLPLAFRALGPLRAAKGPLDPACSQLRRLAGTLHLSFGLPYAVSFLFS